MQRRQRPVGDVLEKRKMHEVDVEMQDIELVGTLADLVQHREMGGDVGFERVGSSRIACSRTGTRRAEVRASALANSVTSWPSSTSESAKWATTRSVPP